MAAQSFIKLTRLAKDITGNRYGRLTVLGPVRRDKAGRPQWLCRCDCGGSLIDQRSNVERNVSCGCHKSSRMEKVNLLHGQNRKRDETPTHRTWRCMIARCENPENDNYKNYGARGVKVCPRWRRNFKAFYADMGDRPAGKTIDRIDPDGNYEPGNCRWATAVEQRQNQRRAH